MATKFEPRFVTEIIDGTRMGKLTVPLAQTADWINFLVTPHYRAEIIAAEQTRQGIEIYFAAGEGLYAYLEGRLGAVAQAA
ncbi:MAG: hypothetical protein ICV62_09430 [Cyanobacteria bacterium Co-bin13]|nr:hypothetical protein [Cyanobacteria bacterium Co-bin13]